MHVGARRQGRALEAEQVLLGQRHDAVRVGGQKPSPSPPISGVHDIVPCVVVLVVGGHAVGQVERRRRGPGEVAVVRRGERRDLRVLVVVGRQELVVAVGIEPEVRVGVRARARSGSCARRRRPASRPTSGSLAGARAAVGLFARARARALVVPAPVRRVVAVQVDAEDAAAVVAPVLAPQAAAARVGRAGCRRSRRG